MKQTWIFSSVSKVYILRINVYHLKFFINDVNCNYYYDYLKQNINFNIDSFLKVIEYNNIQLVTGFSSELNYFLKGWKNSIGCKLKFKRKGSWMRIRRRWPAAISLKVGLGHYQRITSADTTAVRYKKYLKRHELVFVSYDWLKLKSILKKIYRFRPMNPYTKRGIRLGRQAFYRRQGKQSRYTAMKSKIF